MWQSLQSSSPSSCPLTPCSAHLNCQLEPANRHRTPDYKAGQKARRPGSPRGTFLFRLYPGSWLPGTLVISPSVFCLKLPPALNFYPAFHESVLKPVTTCPQVLFSLVFFSVPASATCAFVLRCFPVFGRIFAC